MMAEGAPLSRRDTLTLGAAGAAWALTPKGASAAKAAPKPKVEEEEEEEESDFVKLKDGEGLEYSIIEDGKGPKAKIGDLVAIRFKASYKGTVCACVRVFVRMHARACVRACVRVEKAPIAAHLTLTRFSPAHALWLKHAATSGTCGRKYDACLACIHACIRTGETYTRSM